MNFENQKDLVRKLTDAAHDSGALTKLITHIKEERACNNAPTEQKHIIKLLSKVDKYYTQCLTQLSQNTTLTGIKPLAVSASRDKFGTYNVGKGKRPQHIWSTFNKYLQFFEIYTVGNNLTKTLTQCAINGMYASALAEHITGVTPEIITSMNNILTRYESSVTCNTKIDVAALKQAIRNGSYYNGYETAKGIRKEVVLSSAHINQMKKICSNTNTDGYLQQNFDQRPSGRFYNRLEGAAPTLLSMSRVVRNLAASEHTMIDINSSCFAVFLAVANWQRAQYGTHTDQYFLNISKYINNTSGVRQAIALDVLNAYAADHNYNLSPGETPAKTYKASDLFNDHWAIKMVKKAISAIGFGAKLNGTASRWTDEDGNWKEAALTTVLGKHYHYFTECKFVQDFIAEYDCMSEGILNLYSEGKGEIYPGVKLPGSNSSDARRLSFIYQAMERQCLDIMIESTQAETLMCIIHDGIMLEPVRDKAECKRNIQEAFKRDLFIMLPTGEIAMLNPTLNTITVSVETHRLSAINTNASTQTNTQLHIAHMRKEEERAQEAVNIFGDGGVNPATYEDVNTRLLLASL